MKKVFIVHGWAGNPTVNWFPWLKSELEKQQIEVSVLSMPDSENPNQESWVNYLNKNLPNPNDDTILIGHSLGGITILRYIESLSDNVRLGGIVLVSAFAKTIGYPEPDSFLKTAVDFEKIKKVVSNNAVIINSDNDPYVPNSIAEDLYQNVGGEFISIHSGGHLTDKDGFVNFPEVLKAVNKFI